MPTLKRNHIICERLTARHADIENGAAGGGDGVYDGLEVNSPTDIDNIKVIDRPDRVAAVRNDEENIGALVLQQPIHHDNVSSGESGYGSFIQFVSSDGSRYGTLGYDVTNDGHDHLGIYTGRGDYAEDGKPVKRMNIQGGDDTTSVDMYAIDQLRFGPRGSSGYGNLDLVLDAETDQHTYINFNYEGADRGAAIQYAHDWDQLRMTHSDGSADVRVGDGNGDLTARNGGSYGEGKLALGSNGAGLLTDGGHVYAVNQDGEESLIV